MRVERGAQRCAVRATLLTAILLVWACGGADQTTPTARVTSVVVSPDTASVVVGATLQFLATAKDAGGRSLSGVALTWSSSDPTIANIDATGTLRAQKPGGVVVSATVGGASATSHALVIEPPSNSAVVKTNDTTHVEVGIGSSVTVPAGWLPSGSNVSIVETGLPAGVDSAGMGAFGHAIHVTLRASGSSDVSRTVVHSATAAAGTLLLHISQVLTYTQAVATSDINVAVQLGDATGTVLMTKAQEVDEHIDALGRTVVDAYVSTSRSLGNAEYTAWLVITRQCDDAAWSLRGVAGSTPSANKVPIILIHGWQIKDFTCNSVLSYSPEADPWAQLITAITSNSDLNSRYELLVYRYPTFKSIGESASRFEQTMPFAVNARGSILVGHSMGGLVAAKYLIDTPTNRVHDVFTIGTPFGGSPLAVPFVLSAAGSLRLSACGPVGDPGAGVDLAAAGLVALAGGGDLAPTADIVSQIQQSAEKFSDRLTVLAGSMGCSDFPGVNDKLLGYLGANLEALGFTPSDAIVPLKSAQAVVTATQTYRFDHTDLPKSTPVVQFLLQRLGALRTVIAATPTNLIRSSGNAQTSSVGSLLPQPLVVRVTDAAGVGAEGIAVNFRVTSGGGSLSATTATTDGSGFARSSLTLGSAVGANAVEASSTGLAGSPVQFTATATPPCPVVLAQLPFTITGIIQASDCADPGTGMVASDRFAFSIANQAAVRLTGTPSGFSPTLTIRSTTTSSAFIIGLQSFGQTIVRRWILSPDSYQALIGTTVSGETGTYTLTGVAESEDNTSCEGTYLLGSSILTRQHLSLGDCTDFGQLSDHFALYSPLPCTITMRSPTFDAYLEIYDQDNNLIASDDDSGGGTDARVSLPACFAATEASPHQVLFVRATSFAAGEQGAYTLQIQMGTSSVVASRAAAQQAGYPASRATPAPLLNPAFRVPKPAAGRVGRP
jgi:pimeloyl-ACP methyl ester carboxylesterase